MSTNEKKEVNQQKERVPNKKKVLLWLSSVLLFIAGCYLWWFLQGKAVGTIRVQDSDEGVSLNKKSEKRLYKGKFVEFSHDSEYVEKFHHLPETGPVREALLLSTLDVEGRKIAVTVTYRGTEDLASEPAFQIRQTTPDEYYSKNFEEGDWKGVLFEKNRAPFERTVFIAKSGFITSISITSPFRGDGIEDEIRMLTRDLSFSFE